MPKALFKYISILLLSAGLYFLFVALFSRVVADNDLWGYLSFGRIFWEDGYFPYGDVFSYTPTKAVWVYHEWLTGLSFYFIYKYAGAAGLQLLRYIIILATIYLIYLTAVKRGGTPLFACIALVPAILLISFGYVPVRAQVFTYFFFILTVYLLESARKGNRWTILAWLLPVQILWCNFHGGFVAGLGLIGLYAMGEGLSGRKYIPILIAGVLAASLTVINPYGFSYWAYTVDALSMPRPEIDEWASVLTAIKRDIYGVPIYVFAVMSFLSLLGCLCRRRKDYTDILVTAIIIYIGVSHVRHSIFLGLIFGAYIPVVLSEHWNILRAKSAFFQRRHWFPGAALVVLLLMTYLCINPFRALMLAPSFKIVTPQSNFPVGAVKWVMQNNVKGNILPHFDWGEFLIWHLYPACRVAMDGRYETVYGDHVRKEYFDFLQGRPDWKVFLQKYRHDMVLIKANTRTHSLMQNDPEWRVAYMDHESVLFMRKLEDRRTDAD
ncbi:MAG: hypothetical protein Q7I89_08590 [Syntrophales bacterium]|nr:hypothetical protein [Syntrophales bacterium]